MATLDLTELLTSSLATINLGDGRFPGALCLGPLPQGIDTTCRLLRLLVGSVSSRSTMSVTAMKRCVFSIIDQYQRLWNVLMRVLDGYSEAENQSSKLVEYVFQSMQDLVMYLVQPLGQRSVRQRVHTWWAQCIDDMLNTCQASSFNILTNEIISVLDTTVKISTQSPEFGSTVCETLQSTVKRMADEENGVTVVYTKIQVSLVNYDNTI